MIWILIHEDYQIALEYHYELGKPDDLEAWVTNELTKPAPHHDLLFEVFHRPKQDWGGVAIEMAETLNHFQVISEEGAVYARQLLKQQCERLLDKTITPLHFCQIFSDIENNFLWEETNHDIDISWLGDLYNACDWCDEKWTVDNSPYLVEEVKNVIAYIETYGEHS